MEYDLACEPLKSMKCQIIADFIVKHWINDEHDLDVGYITCPPWKLYFNGSVCDDGQRIGIVLVSPNFLICQVDWMRIARCETY